MATDKIIKQTDSYFTWLQGLIGLLTVVLGIGINYGVTSYRLEASEKDNIEIRVSVSSLENKLEEDEKFITKLQVQQEYTNSALQTIASDLKEMKGDIKKLLIDRRGSGNASSK